jgi:hypothetical protein
MRRGQEGRGRGWERRRREGSSERGRKTENLKDYSVI